jgi:hypothetical protein
MADSGWYSGYYKDRNKTTSYKAPEKKEEKKPLISTEKHVKLTKEFISNIVKTNPPPPSSSRYLEHRKKETEEIKKQEPHFRLEKQEEPIQNLITPKKEPKFSPYYSKPYYPSYNREKIKAEEVVPEIKKPKPDPAQVLMEVKSKMKEGINKAWVILAVLIVIVIIIVGTYFFFHMNEGFVPIAKSNASFNKTLKSNAGSDLGTNPNPVLQETKTKFIPIEIITTNSTIDSIISYNGEDLLTLSGKESTLQYFDKAVSFKEKPSKISQQIINPGTEKQITLQLDSDSSSITDSQINYNIYNNKPYLKLGFSTTADDESLLGDFKYAFITNNYDVYSQTGEVYNKSTIASLKNSINNGTFEDNSDYQIFVAKDKTRAVILYSEYALMFDDSFSNNVYTIDVLDLGDGEYAPIYIMVIDTPKLKFDSKNNDWVLTSNDYNGEVMSYINNIVNNIENNS